MKSYLGDSVYAGVERGSIVLTTENGLGPSNMIFMDDDVVESLLSFIGKHYKCNIKIEKLEDGQTNVG